MKEKRLLFHDAARAKLLRGATAMVDAVRITLGPRSKSVLIGKRWSTPHVCNDGVTIARELELPDPEEDLGARMMREAAVRTGEAVGDATTTSIILAHSLFSQGMRNVVAGASAIEVKRGIDKGLAVAVDAMKAMSRPVKTHTEKRQVATVSAHNDPEIGEIVADAVERVGSDGVITVEEARGMKTLVEVVEGMRFDHGYLSPYFVTHPEKMECVIEGPRVLLVESRISLAKDLITMLEGVIAEVRSLLIVAEDVEGEALATLVVNKLRGTLQVVAVKAPGFGDRRKAMLEDMAVLTGGRVISAEVGRRLDQATIDDLGRAERIVVTKDTTTIVGGGGDRAALDARIAQIRHELEDTKSDYDRDKLQERLAKLAGGVAVVRVGAPSEAEMKALREAFDDAISATRAAVAEGIVPGCGLALLRAGMAVEAEADKTSDGDRRTGLKVLALALQATTRQIAENSELDPGVVVERMRNAQDNLGLDAATGRYVDLLEAGIVDATRALRVALENAVSVAGTLLLTEATLTEIETKEDKAAAAPEMD